MGSVYRVMHAATGRIAAAKVLKQVRFPGAARRFRTRRASMPRCITRASPRCRVPGGDGTACIVMEFVDGPRSTSSSGMRGRSRCTARWHLRRIVDAVATSTSAVSCTAISSQQVKIDGKGGPAARLRNRALARQSPSDLVGSVVGTCSTSHEQMQSGVGTRSDIWALGILLSRCSRQAAVRGRGVRSDGRTAAHVRFSAVEVHGPCRARATASWRALRVSPEEVMRREALLTMCARSAKSARRRGHSTIDRASIVG